MAVAYAKDIANHLEFLGYEIDKSEDENGVSIYANQETKPNLTIRLTKFGVLIMIRWSGTDPTALKSKEFHSALNTANAQSFLTKWYYSENDDKAVILHVETVLHRYEKQEFGSTVDRMLEEDTANRTLFDKFWEK